MQIEYNVEQIKKLISVYTKDSFVCFFSDFIRHSPIRNFPFSDKLKSKLKDSLYLIGLRISNPDKGTEIFEPSDKNFKILEKVAELLSEVVSQYLAKNYSDLNFSDSDKIKKHTVHEYTFANYFQNGILNYREQEINHVYRLFEPYRGLIKQRLKIDYQTLIDISNFSEDLYKNKAIKNQLFLNDKEFRKLAMRSQNAEFSNGSFLEKIGGLHPDISNSFFNFFEKPHDCLIFTKEDYISKFSNEDIDIYCQLFSIDINENLLILNYSDFNPLESKPIIKLNDAEYLNVYQKQLPNAIYRLLYNIVGGTENEKAKLSNRKGKVVFEEHVSDVFRAFFKKDKSFKIFNNYYIKGSSDEKDILILADNYAFVVECKTSRLREPTDIRNQAFQRISTDFKDCIQKGFYQCIDVENELLNNNEVTIELDKKKNQTTIDASKIKDVFSIVVTSERLGIIQTNLNLLLNKEAKDLYPWAVSIDDLEIFLSALTISSNNPLKKLNDFLELREKLHGRVFGNDELDICAMFIDDNFEFKKLIESNIMFEPNPKMQNYFDELYFSKKLKFRKYEKPKAQSI